MGPNKAIINFAHHCEKAVSLQLVRKSLGQGLLQFAVQPWYCLLVRLLLQFPLLRLCGFIFVSNLLIQVCGEYSGLKYITW
jgi:hypothetical protein